MTKKTEIDPGILKLMLYGEPGSGKTRTASSAVFDERTNPVLILNSGGNPISIRRYEVKPDILTMEELADYNEPYEWLFLGQKPDHPFCKRFGLKPPYKTVILDSITEVQRMSFRLAVGTTKVGPGTLPATAEIQHFNRVLAQMVTFARLYFELPMHVIITSLERMDKDEVTGTQMLRPLLWGQSASEVASYAYAVGRMVHRARLDNKVKMDIEQASRLGIVEDSLDASVVTVALWQASGKYVAKDQYGGLGPFMTNPTITEILDRIMAEPKPPKPNPTQSK